MYKYACEWNANVCECARILLWNEWFSAPWMSWTFFSQWRSNEFDDNINENLEGRRNKIYIFQIHNFYIPKILLSLQIFLFIHSNLFHLNYMKNLIILNILYRIFVMFLLFFKSDFRQWTWRRENLIESKLRSLSLTGVHCCVSDFQYSACRFWQCVENDRETDANEGCCIILVLKCTRQITEKERRKEEFT